MKSNKFQNLRILAGASAAFAFGISACAPLLPDSTQGSKAAGVQIMLRSANSIATNSSSHGNTIVPTLSDDYCYALHVLSPTIATLHYLNTWTPPDQTCPNRPASLGELFGLARANGKLSVRVPIGSDLRFDLVGIKKNLDGDTFGPDDVCENYSITTVVDKVENGRPKVRLSLIHKTNPSKDVVEVVNASDDQKFTTRLVANRENVVVSAGSNSVVLDMKAEQGDDAPEYNDCEPPPVVTTPFAKVDNTGLYVSTASTTISGSCLAPEAPQTLRIYHKEGGLTVGGAPLACTAGRFTQLLTLASGPSREAIMQYKIGVFNSAGKLTVPDLWSGTIEVNPCAAPNYKTFDTGNTSAKWFGSPEVTVTGGTMSRLQLAGGGDRVGDSAATPLYICNEQQLRNMSKIDWSVELNRHVYWKLGADIDLAPGGGFTPIAGGASGGIRFVGFFDGGNHSVSNLSVTAAAGSNLPLGMFGYVGIDSYPTSISNLRLVNPLIQSTNSGAYNLGALVGQVIDRVTINNIDISSSASKFIDTLDGTAGGLVGQIYFPLITSSSSDCQVAISNISINGAVHGSNSVGGLVGAITQNNTHSPFPTVNILSVSVKAPVWGYGDVGGLVGAVTGNYASNPSSSISSSYYRSTELRGLSQVGSAIGETVYPIQVNQFYAATTILPPVSVTPSAIQIRHIGGFIGNFGSATGGGSYYLLNSFMDVKILGFDAATNDGYDVGPVSGSNLSSANYIQNLFYAFYSNPAGCSGCTALPVSLNLAVTPTTATVLKSNDFKNDLKNVYGWTVDATNSAWIDVPGDYFVTRWDFSQSWNGIAPLF